MNSYPTIEKSIKQLEKEDAVIGFFHEYRWLSNFYFSPIKMYGVQFPTVEHAFQAAKIDTSLGTKWHQQQLRTFQKIITPAEAKSAGRKVKLRPNWDFVKHEMVPILLERKFKNKILRDKLLATGDRELLEYNIWGDKYWGVVTKGDSLVGCNVLGEMLMKLRRRLNVLQESGA